MHDSDIKKMVLEQLIDEMSKSVGSKFKKPDAVIIEKHTTAVPMGTDEDKPMEAGDVEAMMGEKDDMPMEEDDGDREFRGNPMGVEALKRKMGVKKSRGK